MKQKVLIVDDERAVTELLQDVLSTEPYELMSASSAEEALAMLEQEQIDVVISDEKMPGISGTEFLAIVRERYPDTIRMILTGHASLDTAIKAINQGEIYRFFTKPCNVFDLAITIRQALQQRALMREAKRLLEMAKEQNTILEELESKYPGITMVKRGRGGEVIMEEGWAEEGEKDLIREIQALLEKARERLLKTR